MLKNTLGIISFINARDNLSEREDTPTHLFSTTFPLVLKINIVLRRVTNIRYNGNV